MRVIKRNGAEVEFDIVKIIAAVTKANDVVDEEARMTPVQIQRIAESVELSCQSLGRAPTVEEIQDFVEHQIMAHGAFEVAKRYITYRYNRSLVRKHYAVLRAEMADAFGKLFEKLSAINEQKK